MAKTYLLNFLFVLMLSIAFSCTQKGIQLVEPDQTFETLSDRVDKDPPAVAPTDHVEVLIKKNKNKAILLTTSKGTLKIDLFSEHAPRTVNDLIKYVKEGYYKQHTFGTIKNTALYIRPEITSSTRFIDEKNSLQSEKGTVAIVKSGVRKDYISKIYFSFKPNKKYSNMTTIIGQITDGIDLIDKIKVGDKVLAMKVIENNHRILNSLAP